MLNVGLHETGSLIGFLSSLALALWAELGRDLSTAAMGTGKLKFVVKTMAIALFPHCTALQLPTRAHDSITQGHL